MSVGESAPSGSAVPRPPPSPARRCLAPVMPVTSSGPPGSGSCGGPASACSQWGDGQTAGSYPLRCLGPGRQSSRPVPTSPWWWSGGRDGRRPRLRACPAPTGRCPTPGTDASVPRPAPPTCLSRCASGCLFNPLSPSGGGGRPNALILLRCLAPVMPVTSPGPPGPGSCGGPAGAGPQQGGCPAGLPFVAPVVASHGLILSPVGERQSNKTNTTLSGGSLGSCVDEERS